MLIGSMLFSFQSNGIAQTVQPKLNHAITANNLSDAHAKVPTTGVLDVVAIMVEFQPDSNALTSGTGVFEGGLPYLEEDPTNIDPLPHDKNYFEAHLEFAKNYFEQSSDNQLTLNYRVLSNIYRLDKEMKEYSPTGKTFTYEKLADLIVDSWTKVEEGGGFDATGLDPDNTAFIIFHAGVGRDIELVGTSLDITPQDIPSITLKKNDLAKLLDDPNFDGISINNGAFRITNSLILPRTESRRGLDVQENPFVFPLSINGLLVASIGSHLGLPDLFNTETGDSGIGRFGLMDGSSFFAYQGLFPPEPSAWEKQFLGWTTPFEITTKTANPISLTASSSNDLSNIARYNISTSEYFLIENRHRDPDLDGVTLTIRKNDGTEVQQTFTNNNDTFNFQESDFDDLFEQGVLINVSDFDWALPGGLDVGEDNKEGTSDDRLLNGGILIWHIDESVISKKLLAGKGVNSDPNRRGIDLEEAEGSQDIGKPIEGALNNSAAFGIPFDFWWSGNNFKVNNQGNTFQLYENQFTPETLPNTDSNSGAKNLVRFYDFSDNLPIATFNIEEYQDLDLGVQEVLSVAVDSADFYTQPNSYYSYFPLSMGSYTTVADSFIVIPTHKNLTALRISGVNPIAYKLQTGSNQQPILGTNFITATNPLSQSVEVTSRKWNPVTQSFDSNWSVDTTANSAFISSQNGTELSLDFTPYQINNLNGVVSQKTGTASFTSEIVNGNYSSIDGQQVEFSSTELDNYLSSSTNRLYSGIIKGENTPSYFILEDNTFILVDPAKEKPFTTIYTGNNVDWPAISKQFEIFRIDKSSNSLVGYNRNGAILNNLPIPAPNRVTFLGTPLLSDVDGDNIQDIIVLGSDGFALNLYGYQKNGSPITDFPLYIGEALNENVQAIHPFIFENKIIAASHTGDIKAWEFKNLTSSEWPSKYGSNAFNKVSAEVQSNQQGSGITNSILNADETYNWPNPADAETNIRFQLKEAGDVEISIINLSGSLIFKNTYSANGGAAEEILINTSNWSSGAYFALVKATINGQSESKLIKIAVAH